MFATGRGNPLAPQRFALFATTVFAWLFIAFFQLQALEQAVILDLFLEDPHGFFKIVVIDSDCDFLQLTRPFLSINRYSRASWMVNIVRFKTNSYR